MCPQMIIQVVGWSRATAMCVVTLLGNTNCNSVGAPDNHNVYSNTSGHILTVIVLEPRTTTMCVVILVEKY